MGGAESDGEAEIDTHAHRQERQSIALSDLSQQGEMRCRGFVERRDAHEAGDIQSVSCSAGCDEIVGVFRQYAGLLRLPAGVDLNKQGRVAILPRNLLGERLT